MTTIGLQLYSIQQITAPLLREFSSYMKDLCVSTWSLSLNALAKYFMYVYSSPPQAWHMIFHITSHL